MLDMGRRWRRWRVTLRKALRRIIYSRSSTPSIAAGVALGVFIGLTPTVGFQMLIAALLATVFRVNRLAAVLPVWITNPLTIVPIYFFEFRVGSWVTGSRGGGHVIERLTVLSGRISEVSIRDLRGTMGALVAAMGQLGANILVPIIIGSLIVGVVSAAAAYPAALWTVSAVRRRRELRSARKAQRRMERLEAAGLLARAEEGARQTPSPGAPPSGEEEATRDSAPTPPGIVKLPPRDAPPADDGRADGDAPSSRAGGA